MACRASVVTLVGLGADADGVADAGAHAVAKADVDAWADGNPGSISSVVTTYIFTSLPYTIGHYIREEAGPGIPGDLGGQVGAAQVLDSLVGAVGVLVDAGGLAAVANSRPCTYCNDAHSRLFKTRMGML